MPFTLIGLLIFTEQTEKRMLHDIILNFPHKRYQKSRKSQFMSEHIAQRRIE